MTELRACARSLVVVPLLGLAACGGGGGNNPSPDRPGVTLTANPTTLNAGQATTLTWSAINATTCTASGGWTGNKATTGTEQTAALSATTTFTLTCTGSGGSTTQSATATVAAAGNVIVSGRIEFQRPPFNVIAQTGLNMATPQVLPARQVVVEAINPTNRARIGTATVTDAAGNYSLAVPQNTQLAISARAEMVSTTAPTWNFQVRNNTNNDALYVLDGAAFDSGTANSTRNLLAVTGWTGAGYGATRAAAPFAILDTVYRTKALVHGAAPATSFPALNLFWSASNRTASGCTTNGNIGTSFYSSGSPAANSDNCTPEVALPAGIFILGDYAGGNGDTDEFDQHVIAHEFGHYYESKFSRSDSIGGDHTVGDRLDLRVAFGEGWGNAFSGMTLNDPVYRDSARGVSSDSVVFNFEADSDNDGWYSESSVNEILWDLFDSTNDGADQIALGFGPLHAVMIGEQRTTDAVTSIYSFVAALRAANAGQAAGINALMSGESIDGTGAFGDNENNAGGSVTALPVYRPIGSGVPLSVCSQANVNSSNKLGSRRFLRLTLSSQAALSIVATGSAAGGPVGSQPATDPDIYVYNKGALVAVGNTTTTQPGSSETIPAQLFPAGVNIIEVHDAVGDGAVHCMTVSISG